MNTLRNTAVERLEKAQAALDHALEAGTDTAEHHAAVKAFKQDLAEIDTQIAEQQQADVDEIETPLVEQAEQDVADAQREMQDELDELANIEVPRISLQVGYALNVRRAQASLEAAREVEAATRVQHEKLIKRQSDLQSKRQAIINRRMSGQADDASDGQRLETIAADTEGLEHLITNALSELQQAQAAAAQAQQAYDQAYGQWTQARAAEWLHVLNLLTDNLDPLMVKLAKMIYELDPRKGHTMEAIGWRPSLELRQLVA
ncbi:MAG: hypothetical protein ACE5FQ_13550 [Thiogranum sp.]